MVCSSVRSKSLWFFQIFFQSQLLRKNIEMPVSVVKEISCGSFFRGPCIVIFAAMLRESSRSPRTILPEVSSESDPSELDTWPKVTFFLVEALQTLAKLFIFWHFWHCLPLSGHLFLLGKLSLPHLWHWLLDVWALSIFALSFLV